MCRTTEQGRLTEAGQSGVVQDAAGIARRCYTRPRMSKQAKQRAALRDRVAQRPAHQCRQDEVW